MVKDAYSRLETTLFGIVVTDTQNRYWHHLHHKYWYDDMDVRTYVSIFSCDILNNILRDLWFEDINTTIPFLLGPLSVDHGSFVTNYSPYTISVHRYVGMEIIIENDSCSKLYNLSSVTSKHINNTLYIF